MLAGLVIFSRTLLVWQQTQDWRTANATILKFDVEPVRGSPNRFWYTLLYEFQVNGMDYTGEVISPIHADNILSRFETESFRLRYPPGKSVTVIYEPGTPGLNSYLEGVSIRDLVIAPLGTLLLGLWILYLLRATRIRKVPPRVYQNAEDANSPRWHSIYQTVLEKDQIEIRGKAWWARSPGLTGWPCSRVGLVATPNTIAVVRGPFTPTGLAAIAMTSILEFFFSSILAIAHGIGFLFEWASRIQTWRQFLGGTDPNQYLGQRSTAEIVSIDDTIIHGYDEKKHELWFRLPTRPVDDCIKLAPELIQEIEQFIGYVRLMQQSNRVSTDDDMVIEEIASPVKRSPLS